MFRARCGLGRPYRDWHSDQTVANPFVNESSDKEVMVKSDKLLDDGEATEIPGSCREDWVLLIYKINHSTVHLAADAKGRWGFEDMALERRPMTTTIATDARLPAAARA